MVPRLSELTIRIENHVARCTDSHAASEGRILDGDHVKLVAWAGDGVDEKSRDAAGRQGKYRVDHLSHKGQQG